MRIQTLSVTVGNGTARHWPSATATGDQWALCGTRGALGSESVRDATCKRCLKIAPYGTDLTVTPMGTKLLPGNSVPETSTESAMVTADDELTAITVEPNSGAGTVTVTPVPTADDVARMADPVKWVNDTLGLETLRLDKPTQVCICGMMPGARFHKRHCPTGTGDATRVDFIPATERRALASILGVDKPLPVAWPLPGHGGQTATVAEKRVRMRRWNRRVKPSIGRNRKGR